MSVRRSVGPSVHPYVMLLLFGLLGATYAVYTALFSFNVTDVILVVIIAAIVIVVVVIVIVFSRVLRDSICHYVCRSVCLSVTT